MTVEPAPGAKGNGEGPRGNPPKPEIALPDPPGAEAASFGQALGLSATVADWLLRQGHRHPQSVERFLEPKLAELTSPDAMRDRDIAAERLAQAARKGERVAVFGDYDCDGITATAIVCGALDALGAQPKPLLGSRFDDGYGLGRRALERILALDTPLVVTCDCGSSDHESLAALRRAGREVIVIDHHLVPDEPLPALAFLNPHRPDCGFPYKGLASCGLAMSVMAAVRKTQRVDLDLRRFLDLVAIGTIADVAPLDGDNRILVRAGLSRISRAERPGLRALCELLRFRPGQALSAEDVAFRIAPRLNAPGRLGSPEPSLELLLTNDQAEADALAGSIEALQNERRRVQDGILAEAEQEIEEQGFGQRSAIVIGREGWNHGIVGIVAGRLAESHGCPVIVVGFEGERGRGSVRGPRGCSLFSAVQSCAPVLVRYGGHQAAAGLEVERRQLGALRERFEQACNAMQRTAGSSLAPELLARLHPGDSLERIVKDLARLEPCGESNPAPTLALEATILAARVVRGGHLKLELDVDGQRISGFGPGLGQLASAAAGRRTLLATLQRDHWRGGDRVEARIRSILEAP